MRLLLPTSCSRSPSQCCPVNSLGWYAPHFPAQFGPHVCGLLSPNLTSTLSHWSFHPYSSCFSSPVPALCHLDSSRYPSFWGKQTPCLSVLVKLEPNCETLFGLTSCSFPTQNSQASVWPPACPGQRELSWTQSGM